MTKKSRHVYLYLLEDARGYVGYVGCSIYPHEMHRRTLTGWSGLSYRVRMWARSVPEPGPAIVVVGLYPPEEVRAAVTEAKRVLRSQGHLRPFRPFAPSTLQRAVAEARKARALDRPASHVPQ